MMTEQRSATGSRRLSHALSMSNSHLSPPEPRPKTDPPATAEGEAVLTVDGLTHRFGDTAAIRDLSFSVYEGELLTLLGPSGCGKTTTLRVLAGLERPSAGSVSLGGRPVAGQDGFVPPEQRDVGLVFQDFALFPHLSARENVAFGLSGWSRPERDARLEELFTLVDLDGLEDRMPVELSGGQKQRVALARALAPEPEVLLLDEPFSDLDRDLRLEMREEVRRIIDETGVTAVFVTHDQQEALSISDRLAVIHDGTLKQLGHPEGVFQEPASRFVADFLGNAGFLPAEVTATGLDSPLGPLPEDSLRNPPRPGTEIDILVRPDDLAVEPVGAAAANGEVVYRSYLGPVIQYRVRLADGSTVECLQNHTESLDIGGQVRVELIADHPLSWFSR